MSELPPISAGLSRLRLLRLVLQLLLAVVGYILLTPQIASAHNALDGSTPADGTVLEAAPSEVVWDFANPVPLETLTVTLIEADGSRTDLGGSYHGVEPSQVITPLPVLSGEVTVRWRLVGPDGHPVTDRVGFTVVRSAATTTTSSLPASAPGAPGTTASASALPASPPTTQPATIPAASAGDDDLWSTPDVVRWLLRSVAYLAIITAAGVVLTEVLILQVHLTERLRRWLRIALVTVAATASLQLLIVASDIAAQPWSRVVDELGIAAETDAGMTLVIRIVLALTALLVLFQPRTREMRAALLSLLALGLLTTWAFAGHARSMRWPELGIPVDVLHHGAAAAWLGGLIIVGFISLPRLAAHDVPAVMQRFSRTAGVAVGVIVATGLIQTLRLVGNPADLFAATHGKLLALKLVGLAAMLGLAHVNRRRVHTSERSAGAAAHLDVGRLRRAMLIEFGVGLLIIGLTAALVVSTPAASG